MFHTPAMSASMPYFLPVPAPTPLGLSCPSEKETQDACRFGSYPARRAEMSGDLQTNRKPPEVPHRDHLVRYKKHSKSAQQSKQTFGVIGSK